MTELRYLADPTVQTFEATVDRVEGDRVVLDATQFYPTGGGQPHDTGRLTGQGADGTGRTWHVTDVQKKDTVYHTLVTDDEDAEPTPAEGTTVTGDLDWERRYAHMRYHTAQHLLSAHLLDAYDAETTGNQLYADHAHLDTGYDRFTETDLTEIETELNSLVESALPVRWYELDRAVAEERLDPERTRIHLLPDSITEVRIVEIGPADDPLDRTACAGTHVATTDEIGEIEITGRETKGSDEERLNFVLR
ncbi:alanyl-tRNA editing protein [Salinirubrum litoreum]|uniref:Alanyl-tRNA editing protein n=1 Tax=Salinirubrum litoreum TaxID=1126234 RepID=A0ABD5RBT4_9EURY|nr:alanyl-tRNA editing protein [Salinirubrum litoreum]